ncbi:hypothetical protein EPUS_02048 [Endocarpon pusillum Z07020]|uniref:Uncharacterized protein n=1 Tax=Endocarpon pusillum (strain Z07020 / HMAS-L-300199) TaxID=1263415 RepID=U1GQV8_ENDPU|nr:uncharacterized protein EPUS_02048 [Endocarpon pusillum Z07020]ERF74361.1 hypothetical protein EPUS_02048 [Endocarpon pusillum Z07020]
MKTNRTPAPANLPSSPSTSTPRVPALPTPPSTPQTKKPSQRSKSYDQDEMVRRELASLPGKRIPKRRRLFGEKGDAAAPPLKRSKTQEYGKEERKKNKSIARSSNTVPAQRSPPAKRKRNDNATEQTGKSVVESRQPRKRAKGASGLQGLQEALEKAGLDDRAIAERTEQGSEVEYDRTLISELMEQRGQLIARWRGSRFAAGGDGAEHAGAAVRVPELDCLRAPPFLADASHHLGRCAVSPYRGSPETR